MRRLIKLAVVSLLVVLSLTLIAPALAHEERIIETYTLAFGWQEEPAYVGFPNGPELFISVTEAEGEEGEHVEGDDHSEGEHAANPLEGITVDLQIEVTFGSATRTLPLELAWGTTNHYVADLIPSRPGDYSFRVFGTIGDVAVDEVFNSADGGFSTIEPAGDTTFPDELPSIVELLEQIAALEARIAALEG